MAKNGVQDSVHGVQGSVHERRNAQIGIACQAHAASLLYVTPHPTAARRAATLASSGCEMHMGARISLRPLQRRFKARKKPEGYTSTPAGLKRLKTQNTASYDCNAKWERPYLALPNLYTSANSFRKKNSSTLPTLVEARRIELRSILNHQQGATSLVDV